MTLENGVNDIAGAIIKRIEMPLLDLLPEDQFRRIIESEVNSFLNPSTDRYNNKQPSKLRNNVEIHINKHLEAKIGEMLAEKDEAGKNILEGIIYKAVEELVKNHLHEIMANTIANFVINSFNFGNGYSTLHEHVKRAIDSNPNIVKRY